MNTSPGLAPFRSHRLREQVVVITGASSGIGRATAHAFARVGSRLVLAARNEHALRDVAGECAIMGSNAIVVPTDVTNARAVAALAEKAANTFGRIDVWINNAGVGLFGPFHKAGIELHQRVVETNLFGAMNGAAAVLPFFLEQRSGVMITNISLGGFAPVPFAAAYTAGKFGLRGFMAALRQELVDEPNVHICAVFPSVIDTPGFQHGANVSDAELSPAWPVFPPGKVAAAIVDIALHPRDELPVGWPARLAKISYGLAPKTTERLIGTVFRRVIKDAPPAPRRTGNLFERSTGLLTPSGGWRSGSSTGNVMRTLAWAGLVGAGGLLLYSQLTKSRRSRAQGHPRQQEWA